LTEWKQYTIQSGTSFFRRDGWLGVWDALVSAVTGKPRLLVEKPVTLSFWAKHNADVSFTQVQMEIKDKP
jgi:hypothetical protein